jgi:hypothetical protein
MNNISFMNIKRRINDFYNLGRVMNDFATQEDCTTAIQFIDKYEVEEFEETIDTAFHFNPWFTAQNIRKALSGLVYMLDEEKLVSWIKMYPDMNFDPKNPKRVGIVMAGNIPLVGFHDLLSVLISGNQAVVKLSSSDNRLWPQLLDILYSINPEYRNRITIVDDKLKDFEAVIATGSNNTARYFDYYFGKYPNIIRKNRNGISVITGNESKEELKGLANDIFDFFGLGCRNVSKIYVPEGYKLDNIFEQLYDHHAIINHHKYANNFDYNRTVMMLNKDDILENGFVIFKNATEIASPLASVFYERYDNSEQLRKDLELKTNEIQCIVSSNNIPFGQSQKPALWDYADGVDTMAFLGGLDG